MEFAIIQGNLLFGIRYPYAEGLYSERTISGDAVEIINTLHPILIAMMEKVRFSLLQILM